VIDLLDRLARPFLRVLDPEDAHALVIGALPLAPIWAAPDPPQLAVEAFGLKFRNPLGVAAGLDKDARIFGPLLRLGFGFAEVGTVTPQPQPGNPRPRLFRLEADQAVINRLGFNNEGFGAVRRRLADKRDGIVGVNIGANRDSADRVRDYVAGIEAFAGLANYCTINVSSPNTPGLRDLQQKSALDLLLGRVMEARERTAAASTFPVLLKIAPDLPLADLDDVVHVARARQVDGMIVSNTTIARANFLRDPARSEAGGLSGRPLFPLSTRMLAETFVRLEGALPLIGVGGVDSGAAAFAKIEAGATLVELYTALAFRGLGLLRAIKYELTTLLRDRGLENLGAAVGASAAALTHEPWPGN
jgi:dihydroorotate dehydrogenase